MKPITQSLNAGLLPGWMICDGGVSTFAKILFPILTLYAVPYDTWEEWDFDIERCNKEWLSVGKDKIIEVLKELSAHGYIEDLGLQGKNIAVFSFPASILTKLRPCETQARSGETPVPPPALREMGAAAAVAAVQKTTPPAGFVKRTSRKGKYNCAKCKRKIEKGEQYWHKGGGPGDRICGSCVQPSAHGPEASEKKNIPFGEAREAMKEAQEKFIEGPIGDPEDAPRLSDLIERLSSKGHGPIPREKAIIGLVGGDMALRVVVELNSRGHLAGDALAVIGCTKSVIVDYLEAMPEL